jgi:E3 ubiquitin ligase
VPLRTVLAAFQLAISISPIWSYVLIAVGLYLFVVGFRLLIRRRLLLSTPQSKIRSAALGLVEVNGLAVGPYTLHAPITGKPCFYYRTVAWEYQQEGRSNQWKKVAEENLHVPFFLDDNTGTMLIDPRGAELDIHRDFRHEFSDSILSMADPVPQSVRSFLLRHGVACEKKIRVEEYCIKPKNALFIVGTLMENPSYRSDGSATKNKIASLVRATANHEASQGPEIVYLSTENLPASSSQMTQQQKVAAALLKAGITKPAAWEAAGVSASSVAVEAPPVEERQVPVEENKEALPGFDLNCPVVLGKGKNDQTLLISWRSETALARSLGWKSALMLSGGPVLILAGVYLFMGLNA